MKLYVRRPDLMALAAGEVPDRVRDAAKKLLNPVPAVIPGQTDLEEQLAEPPPN